MNLLEPDGRFWGLFTPWHRDDLNARLKVNGATTYAKRRTRLRARLGGEVASGAIAAAEGGGRQSLLRPRLPAATRRG